MNEQSVSPLLNVDGSHCVPIPPYFWRRHWWRRIWIPWPSFPIRVLYSNYDPISLRVPAIGDYTIGRGFNRYILADSDCGFRSIDPFFLLMFNSRALIMGLSCLVLEIIMTLWAVTDRERRTFRDNRFWCKISLYSIGVSHLTMDAVLCACG